MTAIFSAAILTSAFLLFLVEPLVAKMILPYYGGAPAVWNTCMVFFQVMLLLGYGYSHLLSKLLGFRSQAIVHGITVLLPLWILPIAFDETTGPPSDAEPVFWLLWVLLLKVGLPFFALASVSPILQKWFSYSGHPRSNDPYFLYASSNAGSFLALLSYPFLFERLWSTSVLSGIWRYGYLFSIAFMVLSAMAAGQGRWPRRLRAPAGLAGAEKSVSTPLSLKKALFWIFAAFVPSALMLAATNHITTNVAAVPLLWVLPLSLYLLTFVIVFARRSVISQKSVLKVMPFAMLPFIPTLFMSSKIELVLIPVHLMMFFIVALACHGELALARPPKDRLTEYYLLMSCGGALGGVFVAIVSPMVFNAIIEYPVSLFLALLVITRFQISREADHKHIWDFVAPPALALGILLVVTVSRLFSVKDGSLIQILLIFGPSAIIVFSFKERPWRFAFAYGVLLVALGYATQAGGDFRVYQSRNFFGAKHIAENDEKKVRYLYHGTTLHGAQYIDESKQREPLTYYHREGPIGDVFDALSKRDGDLRIAAIGLGAGSIASYIGRGSRITFFEIDSAIKEIAGDERYFSYLSKIEGDCDIVIGDGRLKINEIADQIYDVIIIDAFSSDSIPVHLLTQEAIELYKSKAKKDGILVFHVSNRFLDLRPILSANAEYLEMTCIAKFDGKSVAKEEKDRFPSDYVVLSAIRSPVKEFLLQKKGWGPLRPKPGIKPWTDRYSNIFSLLKLNDALVWFLQKEH